MNWSTVATLTLSLLIHTSIIGQDWSFQKGKEILNEGNAAESFDYLLASRDSYLLINNDTMVAESLHLMAQSVLFQSKEAESLEYVEEGLKYARKSEYSDAYIKLLLFKSEYYGMKGNSLVGRAAWREVSDKMQFKTSNEISAMRAFGTAYLSNPSDTFEQIMAIGLQAALAEGDSNKISNAYRVLSERATIKLDMIGAIENSLKGIKFVPYNSRIKKVSQMLLLSEAFIELEDFDKAQFYVEKTMAIVEGSKYIRLKHQTLSLQAEICAKQNKLECAENSWTKVIEFYKNKKSYERLFSVYCNQTMFYIDRNKISTVDSIKLQLNNLEPLISTTSSLNRRNEVFTIYHYHKKEYDLCEKYLSQWKDSYPLVANIESEIQYLKYHHLFLEKTNQLEKSLLKLKAYKSLKDSTYRKKQRSIVYLLEGEYQQKEKEIEIQKLNGTNQLKKAKLNQRKIFLWFGGIFLAVALFSSSLLWNRNTKIKGQQAEIEKNLIEKDILLDEIHFRVKNSLQTISSILNLQARSIKDELALEAIKEGRNRVNSMALLHENLSFKQNESQVEMTGYFDQLLSQLFKSYNIQPDKIKLEKQVMPANINIDKVVLIGLLLNELVSNALKHAFVGREKGILKVEFYREMDKYNLLVTDDGIGNQSESNTGTGFGSRIIQTFSKKLNAQVSQVIGNGTSIRITFPVSK